MNFINPVLEMWIKKIEEKGEWESGKNTGINLKNEIV